MKFKIEFNNGSTRIGTVDGLGFDSTTKEIIINNGMRDVVLKPCTNLITDWNKVTLYDGNYEYKFEMTLAGSYVPNLASSKFEKIPCKEFAAGLETRYGRKFSDMETIYWIFESIYFNSFA